MVETPKNNEIFPYILPAFPRTAKDMPCRATRGTYEIAKNICGDIQ